MWPIFFLLITSAAAAFPMQKRLDVRQVVVDWAARALLYGPAIWSLTWFWMAYLEIGKPGLICHSVAALVVFLIRWFLSRRIVTTTENEPETAPQLGASGDDSASNAIQTATHVQGSRSSRSVLQHLQKPPTPGDDAPIQGTCENSRFRIISPILVLATITLAGFVHFSWLKVRPDGEWDAMAIWNVRARTLVRADPSPATALRSSTIGHPDYPQFLPATIAGLWQISGTESPIFPQVMAFWALLAASFNCMAAARRLGFGHLGGFSGAVLLTLPHVVVVSQAQIADVFVAAATLAAFSRIAATGGPSGISRVSAASTAFHLSLLVWVKNEGIVLALIGALFWFIALLRTIGFNRLKLVLSWSLIAAVPVVSTWAVFKLSWAPANDLVRDTNSGFFSLLTNLSRWRNVWNGLWIELKPSTGIPRWSLLWLLTPLVLPFIWQRRTEFRGLCRLGWLAIFCSLAWFLVYVVTPRDQIWHIRTSLNRLMLQLAPLYVQLLVGGLSIALSRRRVHH